MSLWARKRIDKLNIAVLQLDEGGIQRKAGVSLNFTILLRVTIDFDLIFNYYIEYENTN